MAVWASLNFFGMRILCQKFLLRGKIFAYECVRFVGHFWEAHGECICTNSYIKSEWASPKFDGKIPPCLPKLYGMRGLCVKFLGHSSANIPSWPNVPHQNLMAKYLPAFLNFRGMRGFCVKFLGHSSAKYFLMAELASSEFESKIPPCLPKLYGMRGLCVKFLGHSSVKYFHKSECASSKFEGKIPPYLPKLYGMRSLCVWNSWGIQA